MLGNQEPRLASYPDYDSEEISNDILAFAETLVDKQGNSIAPMPFQANTLSRACRTRADGKWAAFEFCLLLARQNGKSWTGHVRVLYGLFKLKENIVYSAHLFPTTKKMFLEIESLVRSNHALFTRLKGYKPGMHKDDPISGIRYANGSMSIVTKYGNSIDFVARSKGNARGYSVDFVAFEEAFALQPEHIDAQIPTLAGNSVEGNPTVWYISSAPLADSQVLHGIRNRGIAGEDASLLFMEWSAPSTTSEDELLEPHVIAQANPAYGYRLAHEHVVKEFDSMSIGGYKTERLGIPMTATDESIFDGDLWATMEVEPDPSEIPKSEIVLSLDIPPDRSHSTISAAYYRDGKICVEIIDQREGTHWVVKRLAELQKRTDYPIIYDSKTQAASLADQFALARVKTRAMTFDEVLTSASVFFDAFTNGELVHIGQEQLTDAVTSAEIKPSGAGGRWKYHMGTAGLEISPLTSVSWATYFLKSFNSKKRRTKGSDTSKDSKRKRRVRI